MSERPTQAEIVPDSKCKQGKCAMTTTGCIGECWLEKFERPVSTQTITCEANASQAQESFQREERYIVTKIKSGKRVECVVIESDWPEYEPVWQMLQDRMEGRQSKLVQQSEEIASLKAQLAEAQKVPDGWQLVPTTELETMQDSVRGILQILRGKSGATYADVYSHCKARGDNVSQIPNQAGYVTEASAAALIFRTMLSAAPTYKKE